MKLFLSFATILCLAVGVTSSAYCQSAYEKEYQDRVRRSEINGVYIPKDINDCFAQLDKLISPESQEKFKKMGEDAAVHKLYFSLGRWMWINWSMLDGSRLTRYFGDYGMQNAEDMTTLIIRSYHRKLMNRDIDIKGQVEVFKQKYAKEKEEHTARTAARLEKETGKPVIIRRITTGTAPTTTSAANK